MIIKQMDLPPDILNYICSFLFYLEIDVILKNVTNYNLVLNVKVFEKKN